MNKQSKKNLKQRALKFFNHLRNNSKYKFAMEWTGSLANGSGPATPREDGSYDLDIDLLSLFEDNAKEVYQNIIVTLKKAIRNHERIGTSTRVITVYVEEDGYKYNYDLCFIRLVDGEKKYVLSPEDGGTWIRY